MSSILLAEKLTKLGLQENEARIYLALLELGQTNVTNVASGANLNRTTGYDILERLCLYGVASRIIIGKKRMYVAEPPQRLRQYLEAKKKQVEKHLEELSGLLPDLQSLFKTDLKPVIKFFQGEKEIENAHNRVLATKSTIYSLVNLKNYAEQFEEMGSWQIDERMKRGIKERVLAIKTDKTIWWYNKFYKKNKRRQKFTEYRWLDWDKRYSTAGEVTIFDDKVIGILSKPEENVAFEIENQTFADFLKIIYEFAWNQASKTY